MGIPMLGGYSNAVISLAKPCTPPRKGGVGNDVMPAKGHELQVAIAFFTVVPIDIKDFFSVE